MKLSVLLLCLPTIVYCGSSEHKWEYWNKEHAELLDKMLDKAEGKYAVWDADNTIWQNDLEESLLPFLEMKGVLTRDNIDPSLKIVPFKGNESLFAYYFRLCGIDDKVCYPWIAQVFSGLTLNKLAEHVHALYAYNKTIPTNYWDGDKLIKYDVHPPVIYKAQRELITRLQEAGVKVYIMTAAAEELVRVVATDPKYGLNIPTKQVIGVSMMLRNEKTKELTTSRLQIKKGEYMTAAYTKEQHMESTLTPYLWTPATWFVGKQAAIIDYIQPVEKPLLVCGDSPNDHFMLMYSGGYRIWVARKAKYTKLTRELIHERVAQQKTHGEKQTAADNWIFAVPDYLHGKGPNTENAPTSKEKNPSKEKSGGH